MMESQGLASLETLPLPHLGFGLDLPLRHKKSLLCTFRKKFSTFWLAAVALLVAWVASAYLAAAGSADPNESAGQIEFIDTADQIGIESAEMRIVFDRRSGCLSSLRNQTTQDDYLKEPVNRGNPFRLYSDFIRPFELEDDPADIAATIDNIRRRNGLAPAPIRGKNSSWRRFFQAHWETLLAADSSPPKCFRGVG